MVLGVYHPTWTEAAITAALFSGMILLYAVFTRYFPIVPVWETAEETDEAEAPPARRQRVFGARTRSVEGR